MSLGAEDVQTATIGDTFPKFDVGTTAGHVGGDGHRAALPRARDDLSLLPVIFRVQNVVRNFFSLQHPRNQLGSFNGGCSHQDGLSVRVTVFDLIDHRVVLLPPGLVDPVVIVLPDDGAIGRDYDDIQ